jgi:hypothetical protein
MLSGRDIQLSVESDESTPESTGAAVFISGLFSLGSAGEVEGGCAHPPMAVTSSVQKSSLYITRSDVNDDKTPTGPDFIIKRILDRFDPALLAYNLHAKVRKRIEVALNVRKSYY